MTDNNKSSYLPPRSHHGPHVLGIKLSASSKAMRVYAQLYLSMMGALSVMGVYTLVHSYEMIPSISLLQCWKSSHQSYPQGRKLGFYIGPTQFYSLGLY